MSEIDLSGCSCGCGCAAAMIAAAVSFTLVAWSCSGFPGLR